MLGGLVLLKCSRKFWYSRLCKFLQGFQCCVLWVANTITEEPLGTSKQAAGEVPRCSGAALGEEAGTSVIPLPTVLRAWWEQPALPRREANDHQSAGSNVFSLCQGNCFLLLPSADFQLVGLNSNLGKNNCSNSH